jgi:hypothetical protein
MADSCASTSRCSIDMDIGLNNSLLQAVIKPLSQWQNIPDLQCIGISNIGFIQFRQTVNKRFAFKLLVFVNLKSFPKSIILV